MGDPFKNPWSAEQGLERFEKSSWMAWYDQREPMRSTLSKKFPYKSTLSGIVLVGLSLYFIGLGLFVGGRVRG